MLGFEVDSAYRHMLFIDSKIHRLTALVDPELLTHGRENSRPLLVRLLRRMAGEEPLAAFS